MGVDLSVFDKLKTKTDYDDEREEILANRQYKQAMIDASRAKRESFDLDKLGEQVLFKAASGQKLTPQEEAVGRAYDAKRTQVYTDQQGNVLRKPPAFGSLAGTTSNAPQPDPSLPVSYGPGDEDASEDQALNDMMGGYAPPRSTPRSGPMKPSDFPSTSGKDDPLKEAFDREMAAAKGNPKLQQSIKDFYAKKRLDLDFAAESGTFNEGESNAAGFADRMHLSNPQIENADNLKAGTNPALRFIDKIPGGNFVLPQEYQSFDQGKRDFITAVLRKESGAAIAQSEYENADRQYFPQPGDKPAVIAQKEALRQASIDAMTRSAGKAYKPPAPLPPQPKKFIKGKTKVPDAAINDLWADPSSAAEFDETFGEGAAAYYGRRK